jgi:hypothetical protein
MLTADGRCVVSVDGGGSLRCCWPERGRSAERTRTSVPATNLPSITRPWNADSGVFATGPPGAGEAVRAAAG